MALKGVKKFYAVRNGRQPGVYTSWDEAEMQVIRFPGAVFQGFPTRKEAQDFMGDKTPETPMDKQSPANSRTRLQIYTDGGAVGNPGPGAYGVVIVSEESPLELSGVSG